MNQRSVLLPKTIFTAAMKLSPGAERDSFLDEACFDAPSLRRSVEKLLSAQKSVQVNPLDQVVKTFSPKAPLLETFTGVMVATEDQERLEVSKHPLVGPYKLLELLGQGGMGAVYMAEQQHPFKRKVALKLIRPGMDSREVISRFEAERQALALMDHPNIAKVLDAGTTSTMRPYFVMELVRGVSITKYCENHRMGLRERLELFITVCRAVQHAHQKGIIHRDLKPSNILVGRLDGKPVVKVIDFGVAKALNQELTERTLFTQFAQMIGTPVYMSPEQAEMNLLDIDTRSDIYSLGVLLYELLTGRTPFQKEALSKLGYDGIRRVLREEIPQKPSARVSTLQLDEISTFSTDKTVDARKLQRSLKGELDLIVMTALEKDRELRYKTASEFGDDVQRYLQGHPILASPPTLFYRARKFCTRHWVALTVVLMTSIGLLTGGGVAVSQMMRAITAENDAKQRERETNDLLEASRLSQMMAAFRDRDFSHLSALKLPEIENSSDSRSFKPGSLRQLLKNAGNPIPQTEYHHPDAVQDFSISSDGQYLLSACSNGVAYLWDIETGELERKFEPHLAAVEAVAISPNGQVFVTGCQNGQVWAWHRDETQPLKLIGTLPTGIETLLWSPDGEFLVAGARYTEACVWDRKFNEVLRIENDHRHESFLFSEESQLLYVPTRTEIAVWNLSSGTRAHSLPTNTISNIRTMCWAGKGCNYLVAADRFNEQMLVLDPMKKSEVAMLSTNAVYPQHLTVNSNRSRMATVYKDGQCRVYKFNSIRPGIQGRTLQNLILSQFHAHDPENGRASVAKYRGDREELLTSGSDGNVLRWDLNSMNSETILVPPKHLYGLLPSGQNGLLYFIHDDSGPTRVTTQGKIGTQIDPEPGKPILEVGNLSRRGWFPVRTASRVEIRELDSGDILGGFETTLELPSRLTMTEDGTRIAVVTDHQHVQVWETTGSWETSRRIAELSIHPDFALQFADNGKTLIYDHENGDVVEWDLAQAKEINRTSITSGKALAVSDESQLIAVASADGYRVWNRETGETILSRDSSTRVSSFLFCDQDRILLSGHVDGRIYVSHLPTHEELGVLFEPSVPMGSPLSMQFLPQGDRIVVRYEEVRNKIHATKILILGPDVQSPN